MLYLVCHGYLAPGGEPVLLLEDEAGAVAPVRGERAGGAAAGAAASPAAGGARLLPERRATAEDRRSDDGGVLAALGPRLAEAGVPAVLAMQGNVTMATVERFMPVFFRELQRDGQIDRAVAAARGAVRERRRLVGAGAVHAPAQRPDLVRARVRPARRAVREVARAGQRASAAALHARSSGPA